MAARPMAKAKKMPMTVSLDEAGLLAGHGDGVADEQGEADHDGRDPVPEVAAESEAGDAEGEQQEADGDAGEGAMGHGVGEEGEPAADDERADRAAGEADEDEGEQGLEVVGG